MLGSGAGCLHWLELLDITLGDAIFVNLAILGLGSGGRRVVAPWVKTPV